MEASSENQSVQDQTVHSTLLSVKQHQNLIIDLHPVKYDAFLLPLIECLKYSPLMIAMTQVKNVPLSILSKAYTTANYVKDEQRIYFDIHNHTTSISKNRFCNLLGLPQSKNLINPETISNASILEMFYQMGYKETLTAVSKFKKPSLPPMLNALFTTLFKSFSKRVTGNDCASKLFMGLMYGLYTGENIDYDSILWAQLIQSTHSVTRHNEISCARFWTIVVNRAIKQLKITVMTGALMAPIATFHTTGIIMADRSKFDFIGSILEDLVLSLTNSKPFWLRLVNPRKGAKGLRDLPRKILRKKDLLWLRDLHLIREKLLQLLLMHLNKGNNPQEGESILLPLLLRNSDSETETEIRIEEDLPVHNEETEHICTEEQEHVHTKEEEQVRTERKVTQPINDYVSSPPPSPKETSSVPITIAPLPTVSSQTPITILVSITIFIDSTLPPQTSTAPKYSVNVSDMGANTSGFSTHVTPPISPVHADDPEMLFRDDDDEDLEVFSFSPFHIRVDNEDDVSTSKAEFKSIHEKLDYLLLASNVSTSEAYSKATVEEILKRVTKEHTTIDVKLSKLQANLAMESKITDALALKEEKCKVLETKLHYTQKQVDDLLAEKAVTRSCISDVNRLLSITVRKHLLEKLRPVFAMFHRSEGVLTPMSFPKQGGEGSSKVHSDDVKPKVSVKPPIIKQDPKYKDPLFNNEPIIDDNEDEEPNEVELKRRKARKAEIDEHACIVRKAEEKERAEKEAQATLKRKMLLFPKWNLKRMHNQVVDMPRQYGLDPMASFDVQNSQDSQFDLPITP
uniref:Uncharacterized protein n=1 Tax=Lactuca sativa TaxID=4236 RepID=A0A9R1XKS5_LACSA|nr:hypothetical protein LSAT_V11C300130030 [Lactuca sativa]